MLNQIIYRPDKDLSNAIEERTTPSGKTNITARQMAERYADLCKRSLPKLTKQEWAVILEATNGHLPTPHSLDDWRINAIEIVMLGDGAKRFGLSDADKFLMTVKGLTYAESVAILDRSERFWAAVRDEQDPEIPGE